MSYPTHGPEFHERLLAGAATDGDHASRPDPEDVAEGHLYACSDHGLIYQSDGATTWATWYDPASGASLASASYTITNDAADRTFDANSVTLDELADVVATLIRDLGGD